MKSRVNAGASPPHYIHFPSPNSVLVSIRVLNRQANYLIPYPFLELCYTPLTSGEGDRASYGLGGNTSRTEIVGNATPYRPLLRTVWIAGGNRNLLRRPLAMAPLQKITQGVL